MCEHMGGLVDGTPAETAQQGSSTLRQTGRRGVPPPQKKRGALNLVGSKMTSSLATYVDHRNCIIAGRKFIVLRPWLLPLPSKGDFLHRELRQRTIFSLSLPDFGAAAKVRMRVKVVLHFCAPPDSVERLRQPQQQDDEAFKYLWLPLSSQCHH